MKRGKRFKNISKNITQQLYSVEEALSLVLQTKSCKFDETIDLAIKIGIDPKKQDQQVRSTVVLPNGTGKKVRVLVFAQGEKAKEAEVSGADYIGGMEMVEKVGAGFLDFEVVIACPDMMGAIGKSLGKVLGPRGLMPNPKSQTVTWDVTKAVKDAKAGKIEFRNDKQGNLHSIIGKSSFQNEKLKENLYSLLAAIVKAKPQSAKGQYLKTVALSTTMGPAVRIDPQKALLFVSNKGGM